MVGKEVQASAGSAWRKAQKRIRDCRLAFTTCIGAGIGLLRNERFEIVVVDEASQQTEPASIVPLVKGCKMAILVGDHVQLRATVQKHAALYEYDISLFERLYKQTTPSSVRKVMLDTQYRMHRSICVFSSNEFYDGKLKTGVADDERPVPQSAFHWPVTSPGGVTARMLFIQCAETEDLGRQSKSNNGQAELCRDIWKLLSSPPEKLGPGQSTYTPSIAVLTPYVRQVELLKKYLPSAHISTIDGFQGREADIVLFVTVRCNAHHEIGFLKDMRRLNVAMTRAKVGLLVIGDRATLTQGDDVESAATWRRLLDSLSLWDLCRNHSPASKARDDIST